MLTQDEIIAYRKEAREASDSGRAPPWPMLPYTDKLCNGEDLYTRQQVDQLLSELFSAMVYYAGGLTKK